MKRSIDDFAGNPQYFPILANWAFFNHAAVSPLPQVAAAALVKYAGHVCEQAYLESDWHKRLEAFRGLSGSVINADADEIALVKNTSEGLAIVAGGVDWKAGDRIVTTAVEYPANAYPWIDLQQRRGIELIRVEEVEDAGGVRQVPLEAILKAADHPKTRLITISHVEFATGQRHDLATIGRFCRERGILLCVDGIQSVGVVPVDVRGMNIDYLSADGHKWMLGPEGAGIFYCRRELITKTHPPLIGWLNVARPLEFDRIEYRLSDTATRFECGAWNVPGFLALAAALELLSSIGIDAIWRRVRSLTDGLVAELIDAGYTVVSPRGEAASGIVSFTRSGIDPKEIVRELRQHKIEVAVRAGRFRCSPHFYNTPDQLHRLVELLPRA